MKKMIKHFNCFGFILALCVMGFFGCSCSAPKPTLDPLAGWNVDLGHQPDQAITKDYRGYIQTLPAKEKYYVQDYNIWFLKNEAGQHAVSIKIPLDGTWWNHVLIYDKDDKRIKTIKYASGNYRS
jgi:hypothetical protein